MGGKEFSIASRGNLATKIKMVWKGIGRALMNHLMGRIRSSIWLMFGMLKLLMFKCKDADL